MTGIGLRLARRVRDGNEATQSWSERESIWFVTFEHVTTALYVCKSLKWARLTAVSSRSVRKNATAAKLLFANVTQF